MTKTCICHYSERQNQKHHDNSDVIIKLAVKQALLTILASLAHKIENI